MSINPDNFQELVHHYVTPAAPGDAKVAANLAELPRALTLSQEASDDGAWLKSPDIRSFESQCGARITSLRMFSCRFENVRDLIILISMLPSLRMLYVVSCVWPQRYTEEPDVLHNLSPPPASLKMVNVYCNQSEAVLALWLSQAPELKISLLGWSCRPSHALATEHSSALFRAIGQELVVVDLRVAFDQIVDNSMCYV